MGGWVGGWVGRSMVSIAIVNLLARLVLCDGIFRREQPDAEEHDEVHDHVHEEVVAERVEVLPDDQSGDHVRDECRARLHRHEDALVHLVRVSWGELGEDD